MSTSEMQAMAAQAANSKQRLFTTSHWSFWTTE